MKGGLLIGLGQILFVTLSSIQCMQQEQSLLQRNQDVTCMRSLVSQSGISGLIVVFVGIKVFSGGTPLAYIDKHAIKLKDVASMNLNVETIAQVLGLR